MSAAWLVCGGTATLTVAGLVLGRWSLPITGLDVAFTGAGVVVATRQPRNSVGWLFLGVGFAAALAIFSSSLADHLLANGGPSLGARIAAAYASASWVPMMLPGLTFVLLLFPDGHLLNRRWRWMARLSALVIAVAFVTTLITPGPLEDYPQLRNPLGVEGSEALEGPGVLLMLIAVLACPASLVLRYRRSDGVTRQQIKWLAFAGAVAALTFAAGFGAFALFPHGSDDVVYLAMMTTVLLLPVAAAVAILRYRLYDIDVVINRALVYTALTVTLVGAYLVTVLLAQLVLPARSDLGVAVSTLAAAAVFQPARRRIQAAVDRRFFRRRYDVQQTLQAFGARVRDEVDLDALSAELGGVVAGTMAPAHVSLWLREKPG